MRMVPEEGGKHLGQGRRVLELRKVRGAGEDNSLSMRQPRKQPPVRLAETIPESLALSPEDTDHRLGDLPRFRRVEVPGQLRRQFRLEPGCRVGHRLLEGTGYQVVEALPVSRAARLEELV